MSCTAMTAAGFGRALSHAPSAAVSATDLRAMPFAVLYVRTFPAMPLNPSRKPLSRREGILLKLPVSSEVKP